MTIMRMKLRLTDNRLIGTYFFKFWMKVKGIEKMNRMAVMMIQFRLLISQKSSLDWQRIFKMKSTKKIQFLDFCSGILESSI